MSGYWEQRASEVCEQAVHSGRAQGLSDDALRRYVSSQYPFGPRAMHPYKVWLAVVRKALGPAGSVCPAPPKDEDACRLECYRVRPGCAYRSHAGVCHCRGLRDETLRLLEAQRLRRSEQ